MRCDFFLNNQPDALITPILFSYKTHIFGLLLCPTSGVHTAATVPDYTLFVTVTIHSLMRGRKI